MRRVFKNEIDYVLYQYTKRINALKFDMLIKYSDEQLKRIFALNYKDVMSAIVENAKAEGKTKPEVSYCVLKLRRILALWNKQSIVDIDGGVTYSETDYNHSFPLFQRQGFEFKPTLRTIRKLQAKVIKEFIDLHNKSVKKSNGTNYIKNLNDLRAELSRNKRFTREEANRISKIYGEVSASQEISYFSKSI